MKFYHINLLNQILNAKSIGNIFAGANGHKFSYQAIALLKSETGLERVKNNLSLFKKK